MMYRLWRYDVFRFAQNDVAPLRSAMMWCLPQCAVRHASLGVAVIIGQRPASFAAGKHHSKNAPLSVDKSAFFVGGGWWIRTTEVSDNRFTVCPLWPLGKSPIWSWWTESNHQPADYKSAALPLSHTSIFSWLSVAYLGDFDIIPQQKGFVNTFLKKF